MALTGANELKRRMMIKVDGEPYAVVEVFFASPSARGATTMVRTRLRHLLTGAVLEKSFRSGEKFEEPDVSFAPASFMYADGSGYHFMDQETYDNLTLGADIVGDDKFLLADNVIVQVQRYNGKPIGLQFPPHVELKVASAEAGARGDTASGSVTKVAKLETGMEIRVPLFIKEGEKIKVHTETREFAGRA